MMDLIEKIYLTPPDNEAIPVLKCFFCEEDVYEGDEYYVLNGFYRCEDCLDILQLKCKIMIRSVPRPVDETGALSNRKKYRAERNLPNEQCDNISGRAAEKADLEYHDLKE